MKNTESFSEFLAKHPGIRGGPRCATCFRVSAKLRQQIYKSVVAKHEASFDDASRFLLARYQVKISAWSIAAHFRKDHDGQG